MKMLGKAQKEAWVALIFAQGTLSQEIDKRLAEAGVVSLDVYDILLVLEESPDQRLRMSELAELALISRSGITRLVDRLEKDGLVKRASCSHDRRAIHALLTEKGLKERERAWPIYEKALEELFASKLNDAEAKTLAKLLRRYTPKDHPLTCVGLE